MIVTRTHIYICVYTYIYLTTKLNSFSKVTIVLLAKLTNSSNCTDSYKNTVDSCRCATILTNYYGNSRPVSSLQ